MFCVKCGKELDDEAVICPGCGCWVQKVPMKQPKTEKIPVANSVNIPTEEKTGSNSILFITIFLIVGFSLACLSQILQTLAVENAVNYLLLKVQTTFPIIVKISSTRSMLWALFIGIGGVGCGITAFIFALKEKGALKLLTILTFIYVITVLIGAIIGVIYF